MRTDFNEKTELAGRTEGVSSAKKSMHAWVQKKKSQKGITLVEVSIGLIIAAVLAATAFTVFQANLRRQQVRTTAQLVTEIAADLKVKYGRTNLYQQFTTYIAGGEIAARSGVIPREYHTNAGGAGGETGVGAITGAVNSYGGLIQVQRTWIRADPATSVADGVILVLDGVPREQCAEIIMAVEGIADEIYVENSTAIGVNDIASPANARYADPTADIKERTVNPNALVDIVELTTQCQTAETVDIGFAIGRF